MNRISSDDRLHDLALRVLSVFVVVAMFASVVLLAYRWMVPPETAAVRVALPERVVETAAAQRPAHLKPEPVVLLRPGTAFKCATQHSVTFSDRPCADGEAEIVPLPAPAH
jgi:hypothetical protein